jgi:hypothetical protein
MSQTRPRSRNESSAWQRLPSRGWGGLVSQVSGGLRLDSASRNGLPRCVRRLKRPDGPRRRAHSSNSSRGLIQVGRRTAKFIHDDYSKRHRWQNLWSPGQGLVRRMAYDYWPSCLSRRRSSGASSPTACGGAAPVRGLSRGLSRDRRRGASGAATGSRPQQHAGRHRRPLADPVDLARQHTRRPRLAAKANLAEERIVTTWLEGQGQGRERWLRPSG